MLDLGEELLDARDVVLAVVVDEAQLGGVAQAEALRDLAPEHAARAAERGEQRLAAGRVVALLEGADEDAGAAEVVGEIDARDDGDSLRFLFWNLQRHRYSARPFARWRE